MTAPAYRIDDRAVDAAAFYAAACDPKRSVVVEACAGAGKTWMLVARIVRALLDGVAPQQILAITFTRRAAGEMRTRLLESLRELGELGEPDRVQALQMRGMSLAQAQAASAHAAGLLEKVLEGGRAVEVRTFHAWFAQLLRQAPHELLQPLGLHGQMELIEDLEDLRADLFLAFNARVYADPQAASAYRHLMARHGRFALDEWLQLAWHKRVEIEGADAAGCLEASVAAASTLDACWRKGVRPSDSLLDPDAQARWWALAGELGRAAGKLPREAASVIEAALGNPDAQICFEALWDALFTQKGEPKKRLGQSPALAAAVEELHSLRDGVDQDLAHRDHLAMATLSRLLLAEFAALKRRRGCVDMADLERVALSVLADSELSSWVQERLDARVRHLLIDEFQDTSPLQWQALVAWLSAYAGAGGGVSGREPLSVFIVGDPKQSIYRFRRAEPRVFAAARDFVVTGLDGRVLSCDHTRRSGPAVLKAVNDVFGALHDAGDYPGFRSHTSAVPADAGGALRVLPAVLRPARMAGGPVADPRWRPSLDEPRRDAQQVLRAQEADLVARAISELLQQGVPAREILVLSRKRETLRLTADAMRRRNLAHVSPEDNALADAPEVRDLLALLDLLAGTGNDLALAQVLKSPLFGASDADLFRLSQASGRGRWWPALMQRAGGSPALARARTLLTDWEQAAKQLPPHDLLDRVVDQGDLMARLAASVPIDQLAGARWAVESLLAQALLLDGGRYLTPYGFVRALRRRKIKMPVADPGNAVQLLTVHGAKGLEADVVFLVDADPQARAAASRTLLVDWPVEQAHPRCAAFIASERKVPASLRALMQVEGAARDREELNALYVAITRARKTLVLSRTEPHRARVEPSWWSLLQAHASPWDPDPHACLPPAPLSAAVIELPRLARGELPADDVLPVGAGAGVGEGEGGSAAFGRAVHRVLEWSAGRAETPDLAVLADAAARDFGLPAADAPRVAAAVRAVLEHPEAARFFAADLAWAGNEVGVAGVGPASGQVLRIDRLVRLDSAQGPCWWVLDYKLHARPNKVEAYVTQLANYRAAVQALRPGEAVFAAFITAGGQVIECPDASR